MASPTRPYFVKFQGKDSLVDATSPAAAISQVVAPHVTGVRVAKAAEVMTFYEQQKAITSVNEDLVLMREVLEQDGITWLTSILRAPDGDLYLEYYEIDAETAARWRLPAADKLAAVAAESGEQATDRGQTGEDQQD